MGRKKGLDSGSLSFPWQLSRKFAADLLSIFSLCLEDNKQACDVLFCLVGFDVWITKQLYSA
jgi:hypothetical protein